MGDGLKPDISRQDAKAAKKEIYSKTISHRGHREHGDLEQEAREQDGHASVPVFISESLGNQHVVEIRQIAVESTFSLM